jgi:hypothetical protein
VAFKKTNRTIKTIIICAAIYAYPHVINVPTTFEAHLNQPKIAELNLNSGKLQQYLGIGNKELFLGKGYLRIHDGSNGWVGEGRYEIPARYLITPWLTKESQLHNWYKEENEKEWKVGGNAKSVDHEFENAVNLRYQNSHPVKPRTEIKKPKEDMTFHKFLLRKQDYTDKVWKALTSKQSDAP